MTILTEQMAIKARFPRLSRDEGKGLVSPGTKAKTVMGGLEVAVVLTDWLE